MRIRVLVVGAAAIGTLALPSCEGRPVQLLWNTSPSVPAGLYLAVARYPSCGALAVIRLPEHLRAFAADRGYLPISSVMIKPVAGRSGSTVCRYGLTVSIDGQIVAIAKHSDFAGRPLPRWQGCYRLDSAKIFLLSPRSDSFDSRYFGPIHRSHVQGSALPIALVRTSSDSAQASRCGPRRDSSSIAPVAAPL